MARRVLTDVGIWIEGADFAGVANSVSLEMEADTPEDTVFASGGWRSYTAGGLKTDTITIEGFYDDAGPDEQQFNSLGTEESVMVTPDGEQAGDVAYIVPIEVSAYSPLSGGVGELAAMSYAGQGDGMPFRAQVMDVRDNVTGDTVSTRLNLGAIPAGETLRVWAHIVRNAGSMELKVRSSATETGATTDRATESNIDSTRLVELTVDGPVTDAWWELSYDITGASDFDIAAASDFADQQAITVPPTPVTPPTPATHTLLGGLSADAIPVAGELTIVPNAAHHLPFQPFTNMHVLIGRLASQGDITSVILSTDTTRANQIGAFTKFGAAVDVGGDDYGVWVSNQELSFPTQTDIEVG